MLFYNPDHNSIKINLKNNQVSSSCCWSYSFEGIRLQFSSTPTVHNIPASTIFQVQKNVSASKQGMICWRTLFFKETQSNVSVHFPCTSQVLFLQTVFHVYLPKITLSTCFHLIITQAFFLCLTHIHISTFLGFPHLYPIVHSLILNLANKKSCSASSATAEDRGCLGFSPVKIISNLMV